MVIIFNIPKYLQVGGSSYVLWAWALVTWILLGKNPKKSFTPSTRSLDPSKHPKGRSRRRNKHKG